MTPVIRFLGHSGLDIRMGRTRIVCDPWLTPRGAFLGKWHQFPDNSAIKAAELHDTPLLYISHPHDDHFDADTLKDFPKSVRVVIPQFPSRTFAESIRSLGFRD